MYYIINHDKILCIKSQHCGASDVPSICVKPRLSLRSLLSLVWMKAVL